MPPPFSQRVNKCRWFSNRICDVDFTKNSCSRLAAYLAIIY